MMLSILATAGLSLVLYLTGFFVLFTPLPTLLTAYKKGLGVAIASVVVSFAVLIAFYRLPAEPLHFLPLMAFSPTLPIQALLGLSILYFSYFMWIACVVFLGSRFLVRLRLEAGFAAMMGAILVVTVTGYFLLSLGLGLKGLNLTPDLIQAFQTLFQKMTEMRASPDGVGQIAPEDLAYLQEQGPNLVRGFFGLFPSLWIVFTMMILSLNVMFVRRWVVEKRPFPQWEAFHLWQLGERWIWAPIVVGGLFFLNLYVIKRDILELVLVNALIVLGAVYLYQGLAIVSFYFRRKFSPWVRLAAYMAIFLFLQPIGVIILGVGIFDFWFDFRKLKKVLTNP